VNEQTNPLLPEEVIVGVESLFFGSFFVSWYCVLCSESEIQIGILRREEKVD